MLIYTQAGEIVNFDNYSSINIHLKWMDGRCLAEIRANNNDEHIRLGLVIEYMTKEEKDETDKLYVEKNKQYQKYVNGEAEFNKVSCFDDELGDIKMEVEYRAETRARKAICELFLHLQNEGNGFADMNRIIGICGGRIEEEEDYYGK